MSQSEPQAPPAARTRPPTAMALRVTLGLFLVVAVAATPVKAGWIPRNDFWCELSSPPQLWIVGLANLRHLVAYGVLVLLGTASFPGQRLATVAATTFALGILVELEQGVFADGHCRVRDLAPNALAISAACLLAIVARRRRRASPKSEKAG